MDDITEIKEQESTQKQAINFKKEKIIRGITCPACAGELDIRDGIRTFNCKYCGTLLTSKGDSESIKFYVPKKISRDDAINRMRAWLGKGMDKAKGLASKSKVEDAFLVYIPYWRVRADVVGWVFGQEKRTRSVNGRTQTYYVDVEKKIQKPFDNTFAACDISELGVNKVNLVGDEIRPIDFDTLERDGMIFNIISSRNDVSGTAFGEFKTSARSEANLYNVTFEQYNLVREDISVVYYPLWVTRYSFMDRTYQVVIDAEDGTISYGKAPGNNLYRAVVGIFGMGVGTYMATLFGIFGLTGLDEAGFFGYIIALVFGIAVMTWGYRKFRYGGEIEEGTGIIKVSKNKQKVTSVLSENGIDSMAIVKNVGTAAIAGSVLSAFLNASRR
jgi:hypothetical protein